VSAGGAAFIRDLLEALLDHDRAVVSGRGVLDPCGTTNGADGSAAWPYAEPEIGSKPIGPETTVDCSNAGAPSAHNVAARVTLFI
jgi:hypothetical protein